MALDILFEGIELVAEGNRTFYGEPVKRIEIVDVLQIGIRSSPPVRKFVDRINALPSQAPNQADSSVSVKHPAR